MNKLLNFFKNFGPGSYTLLSHPGPPPPAKSINPDINPSDFAKGIARLWKDEPDKWVIDLDSESTFDEFWVSATHENGLKLIFTEEEGTIESISITVDGKRAGCINRDARFLGEIIEKYPYPSLKTKTDKRNEAKRVFEDKIANIEALGRGKS